MNSSIWRRGSRATRRRARRANWSLVRHVAARLALYLYTTHALPAGRRRSGPSQSQYQSQMLDLVNSWLGITRAADSAYTAVPHSSLLYAAGVLKAPKPYKRFWLSYEMNSHRHFNGPGTAIGLVCVCLSVFGQ